MDSMAFCFVKGGKIVKSNQIPPLIGDESHQVFHLLMIFQPDTSARGCLLQSQRTKSSMGWKHERATQR